MKEYERTAVKAILSCEGSAAVKALTINPLVANFDIAQEIFDRFLELNKEFCGVWT
jgi:alpha-galactosidase/6-phospho-beta-glucosidase family protein